MADGENVYESVMKINLQFEGDEKIYTVDKAIKNLNSSIQGARSTLSSMGGAFSDYMDSAKRSFQNTRDFINEAKENMRIDEYNDNGVLKVHDDNGRVIRRGSDFNTYSQYINAGNYEIGARSIVAQARDLKRVKELANIMHDQIESSNINQKDVDIINGFVPQIRALLRTAAQTHAEKVTSQNTLWSDKALVDHVKTLTEYDHLYSDIKRQMMDTRFSTRYTRSKGKGFSVNEAKALRQYMDAMLEFELINSVDKTNRGTYMSHYNNLEHAGKVFTSYKEMLPKPFRKLASDYKTISDKDFNNTIAKNNSANSTVTQREMEIIKSLVHSNEFAAQAFEQMGVVFRDSGMLQIYKTITRQQVGGAAGLLYGTIETGARGAPRFGVTDVNDPRSWEKISQRTNARMLGGLQAARYMSDNFGWLNPEIYTSSQIAALNSVAAKRANELQTKGKDTIGAIRFPSRPNTYEVAHYSLMDAIDSKGILWDNGYESENDKKFDISGSLHLDSILKASRGALPKHNTPINEIFYIDIPDELKNPNTPKKQREAMEEEIGKLFVNGKDVYDKNGNVYHYEATRINPRSVGIEMMLATKGPDGRTLADKVNMAHGGINSNFVYGGYSKANIHNALDAAKYLEYSNKNATEGVSIQDLLGFNYHIRPEEIVLTDLKTLTQGLKGAGLDGASWLASDLVGNTTFQARLTGTKSVLNSLNIKKFVESAGGAIPVQSISGRNDFITDLTKLILNKEDLKALGLAGYPSDENDNLSPEDEKRLKQSLADRINRGELYASKTSEQVNKSGLSWIPAQLAQTLKMTDDQADAFARKAFEIIQDLGTPEGQIKYVFSGEEHLHNELSRNPGLLNSPEFISRVAAFRRNVFERLGRGDLPNLTGEETSNAFAAPWAWNVMTDQIVARILNKTLDPTTIPENMLAQGVKATSTGLLKKEVNPENEKDVTWRQLRTEKEIREAINTSAFGKIRLEDAEAFYGKSNADTLAMARFPATVDSLQMIKNVAHQESRKDLLKQFGLDPNSFYVSPSSERFALMQSPDFDGDQLQVFGLDKVVDSKKNRTYVRIGKDYIPVEEVYKSIAEMTRDYHQQINKAGEDRAGSIDDYVKAYTSSFGKEAFGENMEFDANNPRHWGKLIGIQALQSWLMGAPSAIQRNAFQLPINADTAFAVMVAARQYDRNSTSQKKLEYQRTEEEGLELMNAFKPWTEFNNTLKKARNDQGRISYGKFRDTNLYKINAPLATMSGNVYSSLLARMIGKRHGFDPMSGVDWRQAFGASRSGILSKLVSQGVLQNNYKMTDQMSQYVNALEKWQTGLLGSDFLITSNEDALVLGALYDEALKAEEKKIGATNAARLMNEFGSNVIHNLKDENLGLREGVVLTDPTWQSRETSMSNNVLTKGLNLYSNLDLRNVVPENITAIIDENRKQRTSWELMQGFTTDELKHKFDNTRWSITNILGFADENYGGANWLTEHLGIPDKKEDKGDESTAFGHAVEDIIQDYLTARERMASKHDDFTLTKEEEEKLNGIFLNQSKFDDYLREQLTKVGLGDMFNQIVSPIEEGGTYLSKTNAKYNNFIRNWLSGAVAGVLPNVQNYQYVGSEHALTYADMGRMLTEDKALPFTGYEDLLFRNRNTGQLLIGDIKTYGGLKSMSASKLQAVRVQTMLYSLADQFENGGMINAPGGRNNTTWDSRNSGFEDLFVLDPTGLANRLTQFFGANEEDRAINKSNVKRAIAFMQGLAETKLNAATVKVAQTEVEKLLYGDLDEVQKTFFDDASKATLSGNNTNASENVGASLVAHEEFKETLGRLQKASRAIFSFGQGQERVLANPWDQFKGAMKTTEDMARDLEAAGHHTEAVRAQKEVEEQRERYYENLPNLVRGAMEKTTEQLSEFNTGITGTKEIGDAINIWKTLSESVDVAAQAVTHFNKEIVATQSAIQENQEEEKKLSKKYEEDLKEAGDDKEKIAKAKEKYENARTALTTNGSVLQSRLETYEAARKEIGDNNVLRLQEQALEQAREKILKQAVNSLAQTYVSLTSPYTGIVGPDKDVKSINEMVEAYKVNVGNALKDIETIQKSKIAGEGNYFTLANAPRFQELLSDNNIASVRHQLANDYLNIYEDKFNQSSGGPKNSLREIDMAVAEKRIENAQILANLQKVMGGEGLDILERERYQNLVNNILSFDYDKYREEKEKDTYESLLNKKSDEEKIRSKYQEERDRLTGVKNALDETKYTRTKDSIYRMNPETMQWELNQPYKDLEEQIKGIDKEIEALDKAEKAELLPIKMRDLQSSIEVMKSLGVNYSAASARNLRVESFANTIEKLNREHNLPKELEQFIDKDGNANIDLISSALQKEIALSSELQTKRLANQDKLNEMQFDSRFADTQRRYDMSRYGYGSTIIGRSAQQNAQQYQSWARTYDQYSIQKRQADDAASLIQMQINQGGHTPEELAVLQQQLANATNQSQRFADGMQQAKHAMNDFGSMGGLVQTSLINLNHAFDNLIMRLGRRVLMSAFKEAVNFARQFNASMVTIQQITGKSDSEMEAERDSVLQQAKELKTSVNNVAQTRAALYRQGLSDSQVEERSNAIIKFSTVTGSKITTATKGLTTALQSGLVSSVEEAMDVLVALGDSAATTADEIDKGMQKAAASAKIAGVSYAELTSMLTIATSKTQLSGTQVGTFFQTLFSRMNRVTKEKYYTDEGGESTSINDVEDALSHVGISLRDSSGKSFRSAFDVLRDVAVSWGGMNDLQKNNITYAMVGNRNANMFNALMDGMSEDNGALLDEYLGLANNSEGTTQNKYEIAIKGIQAAIDNMKASFDGFIESLGSSNIVTGAIDFITNIFNGFATLNEQFGSSISLIGILIPLITGLITKMAILGTITGIASGGFSFINILPALAGILSTIGAITLGGAAFAIAGGSGNLFKKEDTQYSKEDKEFLGAMAKRYSKENEETMDAINTIRSAMDAYKDDTSQSVKPTESLSNAVSTLGKNLSELAGGFDTANASAQDYIDLIERAKGLSTEKIAGDATALFNKAQNNITTRMNEMRKQYEQEDAYVPASIDDIDYDKSQNLERTITEAYQAYERTNPSGDYFGFIQSLYESNAINGDQYLRLLRIDDKGSKSAVLTNLFETNQITAQQYLESMLKNSRANGTTFQFDDNMTIGEIEKNNAEKFPKWRNLFMQAYILSHIQDGETSYSQIADIANTDPYGLTGINNFQRTKWGDIKDWFSLVLGGSAQKVNINDVLPFGITPDYDDIHDTVGFIANTIGSDSSFPVSSAYGFYNALLTLGESRYSDNPSSNATAFYNIIDQILTHHTGSQFSEGDTIGEFMYANDLADTEALYKHFISNAEVFDTEEGLGFLQALANAYVSQETSKGIVEDFYKHTQEERENNAKELLASEMKDALGVYTLGDDELAERIVNDYTQRYIDQKTGAFDWENAYNWDNLSQYMEGIFNAGPASEMVYKLFKPTSTKFKYNVGGEYGFGFNELTDESILEAWDMIQKANNGLFNLSVFRELKDEHGNPYNFVDENGNLDLDKVKEYAVSTSNPLLKAYMNAFGVSDLVTRSSADEGFIKDYRSLFDILTESGNKENFAAKTVTDSLPNFQKMVEADKTLQTLVDDLDAATGEDATTAYNNLLQYTFSKAFGGSGAYSTEQLTKAHNLEALSWFQNVSPEEGMAKFMEQGLSWLLNGSLFSDANTAEAIERMMSSFVIGEDGQLKFTGTEASWLNMIQQLTNATGMAGLTPDTTFSSMTGMLNSYAGNAGYGNFIGALSSENFNMDNFMSYLGSAGNEDLKSWVESLMGGTEGLQDLAAGGKTAEAAIRRLITALGVEGVKAASKFGDYADEVSNNLEGLGKNAKSSMQTMGSMYKTIDQLHDQALAIQKGRGKSGKQLDEKTRGVIAGATGVEAESLKNYSKESVESLLDSMENATNEEFVGNIGQTLFARLQEDINKALGSGELTIDQVIKMNAFADGEIDVSEVEALARQLQDEELAALASYAGLIGELKAKYDVEDDSVLAELIFNNLTGGVKGGGGGGGYRNAGGGGGGGGKSAADKLLQNLKNKVTIADHRIKMTQLQETKYEQLGQLGNVNNMIEYENELQREKSVVLADAITKLREQLAATERGSDDWQKLYEQVLQYEEQLDETNNTIDANTKKMKQNEQAILKTHTDLEDLVDQEIRNRIQIQRDMLDARVQMETTVLDAIKQRYQDEWDYTVPTNRIAGTPQSPPATAQLARANANARKWRGCTRAISSQASRFDFVKPAFNRKTL